MSLLSLKRAGFFADAVEVDLPVTHEQIMDLLGGKIVFLSSEGKTYKVYLRSGFDPKFVNTHDLVIMRERKND